MEKSERPDFTNHFKQLYADLASGKAAENEIPADINARQDTPKANEKLKRASPETVGMIRGLKLKRNPPQDYLRTWEKGQK